MGHPTCRLIGIDMADIGISIIGIGMIIGLTTFIGIGINYLILIGIHEFKG